MMFTLSDSKKSTNSEDDGQIPTFATMKNRGRPCHEPPRVGTDALPMHLRHDLREGTAALEVGQLGE